MNCNHKFWSTPKGWAALFLIGAVTYFLLMEHRQHVFLALPYLIFLMCPLMHIFMHGNHGHGGTHKHSDEDKQDDEHQHGCCGGKASDKKDETTLIDQPHKGGEQS